MFSLISDWYSDNRLTLNVERMKIMFVGSKIMLSKFEDFDSFLEGGKLIAFLLLNTLVSFWTKNVIGNNILTAIMETWPSALGV